MASLIVEFGGRYLEWSTVVDAPTTTLMTVGDFKQYTLREYGFKAFRDLPKRLERVARIGTSSTNGTTKQELLSSNRAGHNEKHVETEEEMVALYGGVENPPGYLPRGSVDPAKPIVLKDPLGFDDIAIQVREVLSVTEGVVMAKAQLPEDSETAYLVAFDLADGKVLTSNFACLQAVNE